MSHGWGRDLWRPPWSGVGSPSKHLHIKANPSHSQGRNSRGAITPHPQAPEDHLPRASKSCRQMTGMLITQAGRPQRKMQRVMPRARGAVTVIGKGLVKAQDTGAMNLLKCTGALRYEKRQTLMAW